MQIQLSDGRTITVNPPLSLVLASIWTKVEILRS
jgi:hypothetical protein